MTNHATFDTQLEHVSFARNNNRLLTNEKYLTFFASELNVWSQNWVASVFGKLFVKCCYKLKVMVQAAYMYLMCTYSLCGTRK